MGVRSDSAVFVYRYLFLLLISTLFMQCLFSLFSTFDNHVDRINMIVKGNC